MQLACVCGACNVAAAMPAARPLSSCSWLPSFPPHICNSVYVYICCNAPFLLCLLRETGHIFQAAVGPPPSAAQQDAKSQMEDAFMRMMEKRMAAEEAAAVAAQDAAYSCSSGL